MTQSAARSVESSRGRVDIPLFPLRLVMFPGGREELQIFERRYMDLVSRCMRADTGFGVCLLRDEAETADGADEADGAEDAEIRSVCRTGTYARIVDWDQLENGLLGITVEGTAKFRAFDCRRAESGVLEASVEFIGDDSVGREAIPVDGRFAAPADLLQSLERHPMVRRKNMKIDYNDLRELGWRLGELMPVGAERKQRLLELDDPWERMRDIERMVSDIADRR